MDISRSIALVETEGSDLERARLHAILYKTPSDEAVVRSLAEIQNIDGGFPHAMADGNLSTVDTTLSALRWMDQLGLLSSNPAEKAINFLLDVQDDDGAWDEDRAIQQYEIPLWIKPGRPQTLHFLTARAAFWLGVVGAREEPPFRRAVSYLARHQEATGKFPGHLPTVWIATGAFLLDDRRSEAAQKGLRFLEQKPVGDYTDPQLAWIVNSLSTAGLPVEHPIPSRCLDELVGRRDEAGGWACATGDFGAVDATLEILRALVRGGVVGQVG